MRPVPAGWILGTTLGFLLMGALGGPRADEPAAEKPAAKPKRKTQEDLGLKHSGSLLVLESEQAVHDKAEEVRGLQQKLSHAVAQQRATLGEKEYQETIKELTAELNQLRAQSNATTQSMNRIPKRRGYPVYFEQYQELNYYRTQLQAEISQRTAFLSQIKSKPFDPKDRIRADADVRNRREAVHQGALELRKLVDEIHSKYAALEKEPQVKKWLDTPEGPAAVKPKLGPSRAFKLDEKILERVERESGTDEAGATSTKASRKRYRTTKAKSSAGSPGGDSPF